MTPIEQAVPDETPDDIDLEAKARVYALLASPQPDLDPDTIDDELDDE